MIGTVVGYGEVWYHPHSLANIMSFANVEKKFKVEISTGSHNKDPTIGVTKSDGTLMSFKEISKGLYLYDATKDIMCKKNKLFLKEIINTHWSQPYPKMSVILPLENEIRPNWHLNYIEKLGVHLSNFFSIYYKTTSLETVL